MSKDLDFDELDKAVSSLMGSVSEKDPGQQEKNLDINTTLGPDEVPTYKHLGQVAEGIGSETIDKGEQTVSISDDSSAESSEKSASPKTPTKRGGRFMDVVHPSSDMKTAGSSAKKVSREGVTIAAPSPDDPQVQKLDTTAGNLPASSEAPAALDDTEEEPVEAPEKDTTEELPQSENEPLSSPFLPDAKVEKRPLGLATNTESKTDEPAAEDVTGPEKPSFTPSPTGDDVTAEPPKKEDDEFSKMDAMTDAKDGQSDVTEHIPEEYKDELLAVEQSVAEPKSSEDVPVKSTAAMSIPKQYQEKPSSGESTSGAIYDTDNYHKPLEHPAKQKSGWMWVIVIVILILIGAAVGAAAFFFGLI